MSEDTPTMEVRARLTADSGEFVRGMAQAQASAQQFIGQANKTTMVMRAIGIASGAIGAAVIGFATKSFDAAARVQELDVALQSVGKSTGLGYKVMSDTAQAVKAMGIEMNVAQKSTLMFAQNNLKLADASKLARVAQDLAVLSGKNSTEEFNLLTYAVMTQRSELFKSAGINGSIQGAYDKMAKSLGVSTKALSAGQKVQAAMNMAIDEGTRVAGTYEQAMQTPSKVLRSFPRLFTNIEVAIGDALLKGFGPMIFQTYELTKKFTDAIEGTGAFHDVIQALSRVVVQLTDPVTKFIQSLGDWIDKFDKAKINVEGLAKQISFLLPVITGAGTAFAVFAGKSMMGNLPVIGNLIRGLNGPLLTFIAIAMTSTKVRDAFMNLLHALTPLVGILKDASAIMAQIAGYGVSLLAKALNGLATVIRVVVGWVTQHKAVMEALGKAVAVVVAVFTAYKLATMAFTAYTALATVAMDWMAWSATALANAEFVASAATNSLAAGVGALDFVLTKVNVKLVLWITAIVAVALAFAYAWKHSETFRNVVTEVFNTVANVVGKVVGWILDRLADFLFGLRDVIVMHQAVADAIASIFNFIYKVVLTYIQAVLVVYKTLLKGIGWLLDQHYILGKVIRIVFNFIKDIISEAVVIVVVVLANIIKAIATLVHWFGYLQDFVGEVWGKITKGIAIAGNAIGGIVSDIAGWIKTHFIDTVRSHISSFISWLANVAGKIPGIGSAVKNALKDLSDWVNPVNMPTGLTGPIDQISISVDSAVKAIGGLQAVNNKIISASESWGNYKGGAAGALSTVANEMLKFATATSNFSTKLDVGGVLDALSTSAKDSANLLQGVIDKLSQMKEINVGGAIVSGATQAAMETGFALSGLSANIKDFFSGDVLGKTTGALGDFVSSLKNSLGFGDVLFHSTDTTIPAQGPYPLAGSIPTDPNGALAKLQSQADLMKKISEAMQSGIDSVQKTIDAMAQAAQDFAKSLKDTIVNFAGLKGVQLPDGFVPQAKSLIANMQEKLNKATQFASQIGQLQSMGLDASALKDIIESGPIQGAQLAASILAGGQDVVNQVSALQRQIQYSGELIGGIGASSVYGQPIFDATASLNKITDAKQNVSTSGNQITIQQGAFQITVDGSGITDPVLLADLIAKKVQNEFDALSRQLAVK